MIVRRSMGPVLLALVLSACSASTVGSGRGATPTVTLPSSHTGPESGTPTITAQVPTSTAVKGTATSTPAELDTQLAALTAGQRRVIVTSAQGSEAVSYDQTGHLHWWRYSTTWTKSGDSSYPYDATMPADAIVSADVLAGMSFATYIVRGNFSGDGSGNAVAYTKGTNGWGAIKFLRTNHIGPTNQGVTFGGIGLENDFSFADGTLETASCSATLPLSDCGGAKRVLQFWRWNGTDFAFDHRAGLAK